MDKNQNFPSLKRRSVSELIPYANNARTHSDEQVAQIAASIKEFGFINPVIVDGENGIVAGHGRVLAARKLGMDEVPTIEVAWLTDAQRKAYILADNKLAMNAGWDNELLRVELGGLNDIGFDITLTGFELSDLEMFEPESAGFAELPTGDREPYRQMAFMVHDSQHELIEEAIALAKQDGGGVSGVNENSNANALSYICGRFVGG